MALSIVYIAVLTAALLGAERLLSYWNAYRRAKLMGCLPPNKYPHTHLLGSDLTQARMEALKAGRRNGFDLELFQKCGSTYEERVFRDRIILTCDPVNIQAVGSTQWLDFGREKRRPARPFFGDGILSMNGSHWKAARNMVTPLFQRAELTDIHRFQKYVDRMMALIPEDGSTVDMQPLLQKLFLDSSTEFIFGESLDSLRDTTGKADEFRQAFNLALAGAGKRLNVGASLSFLYAFDKSWKQDCAKVHSFIDDCIARHSRRAAQSSIEGDDSKPRERYVLIEGMAKEIKDPIKLRFQLLNIFFPARDTSAIALQNCLFFLARNPHAWHELRTEALRLKDQPLSFEMLKGLSLFRYTLFEGIRLQGPSGQIRRIALRDTTLPRGGGPDGSAPVFVPKGTKVYCNNFPGYRNKELWGEDILAFRPSRFEGKLLNWEFTPFFGGPRICPASNQVIAQSIYVLFRLVLKYDRIENRDPCWEYVEDTRMLVESRNGVKIALHPSRE